MWYFSPTDVKHFSIEISNYCNAACTDCPRIDPHKQEIGWVDTRIVSLDIIKKGFNKKTLSNLVDLSICGCFGDPLTHPNILEVIEFFRYEHPKTRLLIHTNGGLRNPNLYTELGKLLKGSDHAVIFGIDGLEDTNDIYRVNVKWSKLQENFRSFINAGGIARWQFILFPWNKHQLDEAKQRAVDENFTSFVVKISFAEDQGRTNISSVPEKYKNKHKTHPHGWMEHFRPELKYPKFYGEWSKSLNNPNLKCKSQDDNGLFLFSDGSVWPCYKLAAWKDSGDSIINGNNIDKMSTEIEEETNARYINNLNYFSMEEILNNIYYKTIFNTHKNNNLCGSCKQECGI